LEVRLGEEAHRDRPGTRCKQRQEKLVPDVTALRKRSGHTGEETASYPEGARARSKGEYYKMKVEATNNFEVPFVVFALLMPFIATGPRVDVLGVAVSQPGLAAAWALLVKGTLGVLASLTLAATTEPRDLLAGLERLRVPNLLVQIMGFMVRYLDVVTDEMRRMRVARESRGFSARDVRHWPVIARSAGALFIRSYERGERVHLAMLSRGYTGTLPDTETVHRPHLSGAH